MAVELLRKQQLLATIAARASTPLERLHQGNTFAADLSDTALQARLHRLYTLVGADNEEAQACWLAQHNLDHEQLISMLSSVHPDDEMALPSWVETLERILSEFAPLLRSVEAFLTLDRCLRVDAPVPFEDLLLPFVCYARQKLSLLTQELPILLAYEAHVSLENWLLRGLSHLAGAALQIEFSRFRAQQETREEPWQTDTAQHDLYDAFVEQYWGENMLPFLQQYSTLAYLLIMHVEQWVDSCAEFLQRLARDRAEIAHLFHADQERSLVTEIIPGASDNHHNGRSVFILTFNPPCRLIYKPRCMDVDKAFFDLLTWINASGSMLDMQGARVLSRDSYGWMEYIAQAPCQTLQEVRAYYERAGMLVCLCYLLGSTDLHYENLVASGEHPVVIDLETIVYPSDSELASQETLTDPLPEQDTLIDYSVLRSLLLPGFYVGRTNLAVEASGLGPATEQQQSLFTWMHINTNAMIMQQINVKKAGNANVVMLNEDQVKVADYDEELITGFRSMYRFLVGQRHALLSADGPLACFAGCPIRFVFRPTNTYWKLLVRLIHPQFLQDRADHWIEIQILQKPLLRKNASQKHWQIIKAEQLSLERRDVPFFTTTTDSRDFVPDIGARIENVFVFSALEQIRSCITSLSEEDMERQIGFIRTSLLCIHSLDTSTVEIYPLSDEREEQEIALAPDDLVEAACAIAHDLEKQALWRTNGSASWMGLFYDEVINRYRIGPLALSSYDGTAGIALFLAALAQITGDNHYQKMVAAALRPLCQILREAYSSVTTSAWGGKDIGAQGLGGLVYALVGCQRWWHELDWFEGAWQAASLITEQCVSIDQHLDVQKGSAGAILGLLALYEISADKQILERAVICGHHLLKHRVETESGARSWNNQRYQKPLIGFFRGASGIAYALLRLYEVTWIQEFKDAASEAIDYEQHILAQEAASGSGFQSLTNAATSSSVLATSWGYGAAGVGLARLGGLHMLDTPAIRHDIKVTLETTQVHPLLSPDNLSYGNFGRIELLVAASQLLQRADMLEEARQKAAILVKRARHYGNFHLLHNLPRQAYNPGLFVGSAGVGYELLRVAYPERIPSLLLWK